MILGFSCLYFNFKETNMISGSRIVVLKLVVFAGLVSSLGACAEGIDESSQYMIQQRQKMGLVIILPGIEGESSNNFDIRSGLVQAGCMRAIGIYNWGFPVPGLLGLWENQTDTARDREEGEKIANRIAEYKSQFPNKPVYIIGHSGGGGVAVFAAESLPDNCKIEGLILLSASLSNDYNLTTALAKCKNGILNFYSPRDGILPATEIIGNVDGGHSPSAGLTGFIGSYPRLFQIKATPEMTRNTGGIQHCAATKPGFVIKYIAPWIHATSWPIKY